MPRRNRPPKRKIAPDIKYNSVLVSQFINKLMQQGKKSTAQRIFYDALDLIEERAKRPGLEVFEQAVKNATPILEVKPRRVGGATYQVPLEVNPDRSESLSMRWLVNYARNRKGTPMHVALANEIKDAANNQGSAVRKRDDVHKMAQANRAFAHFRF